MSDRRATQRGPILAAVDLSDGSADALVWAAEAADRFELPLVVVHVVHDPNSAPGYYHHVRKRKKLKKHLHRIEEAAEEMMAEFLADIRKRHPRLRALQEADAELVVGLPVNRILEVAKKHRVSQIVMGSRGRTGLPTLLLGSKALKVAQLAKVPVTIVKTELE